MKEDKGQDAGNDEDPEDAERHERQERERREESEKMWFDSRCGSHFFFNKNML